jgi:hypothetical protein
LRSRGRRIVLVVLRRMARKRILLVMRKRSAAQAFWQRSASLVVCTLFTLNC